MQLKDASDAMQAAKAAKTVKILASKLFDPREERFVSDKLITVSPESGLILDVQPLEEASALDLEDENTIDLRGLTVLPGFVDTHVHFFLHPYSEVSWDDQLTKEPLAERTVRATLHAKRTLMAGFTTVRDLGTEGAEDADVALRKCISGPDALIPGPRYFVANRAIQCTGAYGPKSMIHPSQEGIDGVHGAEVADGQVECVKAVRRQIGAGADWIKIYADYRFRSRVPGSVDTSARRSQATFTQDEIEVMARTAQQYGVKVACHVSEFSTIDRLRQLNIGRHPPLIHSIEHGWNFHSGDDMTDHVIKIRLDDWKKTLPIWSPTLSVYHTSAPGGVEWQRASKAFKLGLEAGFDRFACGGDTGVFPHGNNALEMQLMHSLGAPPLRVLRWATLGGWKCVRSLNWEGAKGEKRLEKVEELGEGRNEVGDNEQPFGVITKGFAADIIAVEGDLEKSFEKAVAKESVKFVMKAGMVYKRDGAEVAWK